MSKLSNIERDDDGVTWIDGEAYTPPTDRERTFLDVTVEAQKERDAARQQLEMAVDALRAIAEDRVPGMRTVPTVVQAYAQGALARYGGSDGAA